MEDKIHYFLKINKLIFKCVSSVIGISVSNHLNSFNCIFFLNSGLKGGGGVRTPLTLPKEEEIERVLKNFLYVRRLGNMS